MDLDGGQWLGLAPAPPEAFGLHAGVMSWCVMLSYDHVKTHTVFSEYKFVLLFFVFVTLNSQLTFDFSAKNSSSSASDGNPVRRRDNAQFVFPAALRFSVGI